VSATISIVDERAIFAWSLAVLAMTMALGFWIIRQGATINSVAICLTTALTLVASAAIVPLTAAIWLGMIASNIGAFVMGRFPRTAVESTSKSSKSHSAKNLTATAGTIGLLVLILLHRDLVADDSHRPAAADGSNDFQVLIPVDDASKPTSGLYFVPQ